MWAAVVVGRARMVVLTKQPTYSVRCFVFVFWTRGNGWYHQVLITGHWVTTAGVVADVCAVLLLVAARRWHWLPSCLSVM